MNIDDAIQMIYNAMLHKKIKWNSFEIAGIEDNYADWYYAEHQIYAIRSRLTDTLYFVRAINPKEAYQAWQINCCAIAYGDLEE